MSVNFIPARSARRLAVVVPLALTAVGALTGADRASAYNVGVASVHFDAASETCLAGQALPCTAGAGQGDANVLRVLQTEVDGYHRFNDLAGTSNLDDHLWIAAEIGATCRRAHHLDLAIIDGNLSEGGDGVVWEVDDSGVGEPPAWPQYVSVPNDREMPVQQIAVNVPLDVAFDPAQPLVGYFPSAEDIFAAGEAEIERRVDAGMSYAEARAIPYELNTTISLRAEVWCEFNGLVPVTYYQREFASIPLRIEYVPVDVPAPVRDLPPAADGFTERARVTDAELFVVEDPDAPCTLHLSGVIQTNRETDVEYRFLDPYGQPSNTYSVHVDQTQVAMIDRTVEVPFGDSPEPSGDLAPNPGGGGIGGLTVGDGGSSYTGTYVLEIRSPNGMSAADGFEVDYCDVGDPAIDPPTNDVVAEPDPSHQQPTTTLPAAVVPVTTAPPAIPPATPPSAPTTTAPATVPPVVVAVVATPVTTVG